ncbi:hypothetical protein ACJX0J_006504, partial [Zea mays]
FFAKEIINFIGVGRSQQTHLNSASILFLALAVSRMALPQDIWPNNCREGPIAAAAVPSERRTTTAHHKMEANVAYMKHAKGLTKLLLSISKAEQPKVAFKEKTDTNGGALLWHCLSIYMDVEYIFDIFYNLDIPLFSLSEAFFGHVKKCLDLDFSLSVCVRTVVSQKTWYTELSTILFLALAVSRMALPQDIWPNNCREGPIAAAAVPSERRTTTAHHKMEANVAYMKHAKGLTKLLLSISKAEQPKVAFKEKTDTNGGALLWHCLSIYMDVEYIFDIFYNLDIPLFSLSEAFFGHVKKCLDLDFILFLALAVSRMALPQDIWPNNCREGPIAAAAVPSERRTTTAHHKMEANVAYMKHAKGLTKLLLSISKAEQPKVAFKEKTDTNGGALLWHCLSIYMDVEYIFDIFYNLDIPLFSLSEAFFGHVKKCLDLDFSLILFLALAVSRMALPQDIWPNNCREGPIAAAAVPSERRTTTAHHKMEANVAYMKHAKGLTKLLLSISKAEQPKVAFKEKTDTNGGALLWHCLSIYMDVEYIFDIFYNLDIPLFSLSEAFFGHVKKCLDLDFVTTPTMSIVAIASSVGILFLALAVSRMALPQDIWPNNCREGPIAAAAVPSERRTTTAHHKMEANVAYMKHAKGLTKLLLSISKAEQPKVAFKEKTDTNGGALLWHCLSIYMDVEYIFDIFYNLDIPLFSLSEAFFGHVKKCLDLDFILFLALAVSRMALPQDIWPNNCREGPIAAAAVPSERRTTTAHHKMEANVAYMKHAKGLTKLLLSISKAEQPKVAFKEKTDTNGGALLWHCLSIYMDVEYIFDIFYNLDIPLFSLSEAFFGHVKKCLDLDFSL